MGVATWCGCKDYLSLLLLYLYFFVAASLLFCSFKKKEFFVLVPVLFLNYILGIK